MTVYFKKLVLFAAVSLAPWAATSANLTAIGPDETQIVPQPELADYTEAESILFKSTHKSLVRLPKQAQDEVQAYFKKLYQEIRLPTDPEECPHIYLMNLGDANAFVKMHGPNNVIFFNWRMLHSTFDEEVKVTFAHELEHKANPNQRNRAGTDEGNFHNEVEAQTLGVLNRLFRRGLVDENGKPQKAVAHPETVIATLARGNDQSKTHINGEHAASVAKMAYFHDRYLRQFPDEPTSQLNSISARKIISAIGSILHVHFVKNDNRDDEIFDDAARAFRFSEHGLAQLRTLYPDLKQFAEIPEGVPLSSEQETKAKRTIEQTEKALTELNRMTYAEFDHVIGSDYFRTLPRDLFTIIHRAGSRMLLDGDPAKNLSAYRLKENEFYPIESYFSQLEKFAHKKNGKRPEELKYPFYPPAVTWRYMQTTFREGLFLLEAAIDIAPEVVFEPLSRAITEKYLFEGDYKTEARKAFLRLARKIDLNWAIEKLESGQISPTVLAALDQGDEFLQHRLSFAQRKQLHEELSIDNSNRALRNQIFAGDPELLIEELTTLNPKERPDHVLALLPMIGIYAGKPRFENAKLTKERLDQIFSQALTAKAAAIESIQPFSSEERDQIRQELSKIMETNLYYAGRRRLVELGLSQQISSGRLLLNTLINFSYGEAIQKLVKGADQAGQAMEEAMQKSEWLRDFWEATHGYAAMVDQLPQTKNQFLRLAKAYLPKLLSRAERQEADLQREFQREDVERKTEGILATLPWYEIIKDLNAAELSWFLTGLTDVSREHRVACKNLGRAIYQKITSLLRGRQITAVDVIPMILVTDRLTQGWFPEVDELLHQVKASVLSLGSNERDKAIRQFAELPVRVFSSLESFVEFQFDLLKVPLGEELTKAVGEDARMEALYSHRKKFPILDPQGGQAVLNKLAEIVEARPAEKRIFQHVGLENNPQVSEGLRAAHAILMAYAKLEPNEQWHLIQWLRGKEDALGDWMVGHIYYSFIIGGVMIERDDVIKELRTRFDSLNPLARGAFFLVALGGQSKFFRSPKYRKIIESEIFSALKDKELEVAKQIYEGAQHALPEPLRDVLTAMAFAESGRHGSPERALYLAIARMGPLIQKFGQNLALDPHVPESYRKEFQKLWDQVQEVNWWHVQDLIKRQHGDIWASGWRVKSIANSGTTEIFVKLVGPKGEERMASVYVESLDIKVATDRKDLEAMVKYLTEQFGADRYGFFNLLSEDAFTTIQQEMDPAHKRKMTDERQKAYERAALELGGSQKGEDVVLEGFRIKSVRFEDVQLKDGNTLVTQSVAPGRPLKELQETDPELYKKISSLLIQIELATIEDPNAPVDKDRMPGQYFYDLKTRTITFLDAGQAKFISKKVRDVHKAVIAAALINNVNAIKETLATLGIPTDLPWSELFWLLAKSEAPYRPLQALDWIRTKAFKPEWNIQEQSPEFFDLVHLAKAHARLALWAHSFGDTQVQNHWMNIVAKTQGLSTTTKAALTARAAASEAAQFCKDAVGSLFKSVGQLKLKRLEP